MSTLKSDLNKFTPRSEQIRALDYIKMVEEKKPDNRFFLFDLPPGVGKSHLAIMIADYYITKFGKNSNVDIITAGKILQDQYATEYQSLNNLKGSNNYSCDTYSCECESGRKFAKLNKTSCEDCPFVKARDDYRNGSVSLTNYHLYLNYAIYGHGDDGAEHYNPLLARKSRVLIVDEAHEFDTVISDFISLKITEGVLKRLKLIKHNSLKAKLSGIQNVEQYVAFLEDLKLACSETLGKSFAVVSSNDNSPQHLRISKNISFLNGEKSKEMEDMEVIDRLNSMIKKIETFIDDYKINKENWILEKSYNEKTKNYELALEPLWSRNYLDKYVWSRYDKVFLISGTILNKEIFCEMNGLGLDESVYLQMNSPFPLKNRKIIYTPVGKMTFAQKESTFEEMKPIIERILNKYSNDKGIIHSNSFELSEWIKGAQLNERLRYHGSEDRDLVLRKHMDSKEPLVLVSPSVTTGVSFDYDRARFQIIPKVPYPSLGSVKNKLRQKQSPLWYNYMTVAKIIQTYGRVVRSRTDYGDTIILDESFGDIMRNCSYLMPKWFQEAIKIYKLKK